MVNEQLSERLRIAREKIGISKAEASRRLNLSKIGYCRYEYGDRVPSVQTLKVIADCFHTSIDYLLGNTDDMSPDRIVIDKKTNPELFQIVEYISSSDETQIKRINAYLSRLSRVY